MLQQSSNLYGHMYQLDGVQLGIHNNALLEPQEDHN